MSIQTPLGIYSTRRILHGGTDSKNQIHNMLQLLDDFLLHGKSEKDVIDDIEHFFSICHEIGLKINAEKTSLFVREVKFCGRIIDEHGIRFEPRNLDALMTMQEPRSSVELQQLLCATNWMRNAFPNYSKVVAPLHQLMETIYSLAKSHTKRAVRRSRLDELWGGEHSEPFEMVKNQLAATVKLSHPNPNCRLCLFTDAFNSHWASILTQTPSKLRFKPIDGQQLEPLCFLPGTFTGSSMNWSVPEKGGCAVVESMGRLNYLVSGRVIYIFTDNANLVYLYNPYGRNPSIPIHTASKLTRWALKLNAYRFVIEHLPGVRKVWADMLTRWAVQPRSASKSTNQLKLQCLMVATINPRVDDKMDWPKLSEVAKAQRIYKEAIPTEFSKRNGVIKSKKSVIWVPAENETLKLRIIIATHCGMGGHRAVSPTKATVEKYLWWKDMNNDISSFVSSCLHCLSSSTGISIPRPLDHVLHAQKSNEIIHFDYCFTGNCENNHNYILIPKDDLSGYVWLIPTIAADAISTAEALKSWFAAF